MEKKDNFAFLKNEEKVNKLIIRLIIVSFLLLVLLGVFAYSAKVLLDEKDKMQQEIDSVNNDNSVIISQIRDIEAKSTMAKNYIKIWNDNYIPNQKLMKGINVQDIESKIREIAEKNNLTNIVINLSPVILAGGQFERENVKAYTTLIVVKFDAITDINVFKFLDEFMDSIGYFITIQEIKMERTKKVSEEFLKSLANGNITTAISGEIKIRIYGIGEK